MMGYELKSGLENIKNFFKRVLRLKIAIRTTAIKMKHIVEEKKRYRYAEVIFTSVYKKKNDKSNFSQWQNWQITCFYQEIAIAKTAVSFVFINVLDVFGIY